MDIKKTVRMLKQGGFTLEEAQRLIKVFASTDGWDTEQALLQTELIYKASPERCLSEEVNEYVLSTSGCFSSTDVERRLQLSTRKDKKNCSAILSRILQAKPPVIERYGNKNGVFRRIEADAPIVDWQSADPSAIIKLRFPFELEKYIKIFPKSIVIVAGGKDAGKTAFIYNMILLNMFDFQIDFLNSETGEEQMKERLDYFAITIPQPAPFRTIERYDNFVDVVDPDHITFIDYLDANSEVYLVGEEIDKIFRKLKKGVAIIAMQKPPPSVTYVKGKKKLVSRDLAYGGGFTAKRAILYLSLDKTGANQGKLKIVHAKTRANLQVNPNNKQWLYRLPKGAEFTDIQDVEDLPEMWQQEEF